MLGILSLVMCGFGFVLGIPAMVLGRQAKREIAGSQGRLGGDGMATAGFWTGLIATVWTGLVALLVVGVFLFGGAIRSSFESTCSSAQPGDYATTC